MYGLRKIALDYTASWESVAYATSTPSHKKYRKLRELRIPLTTALFQ